MRRRKPKIINQALLWEYDLKTFNYVRSYKIVIERVLERGTLEQWQELATIYPKSQILEVINWSKQLDKRNKEFSKFFLNSGFINAS